MPIATVILPTYNGVKYIREAIHSVLTQSLRDLELIVVDDGSSDNTLALVMDMAKDDQRVKVLTRRVASGGPTVPKNLALQCISSEYVCFLDHDDVYHPNKLERMCEGMERESEWGAAFHDMQVVSAEGKISPGTYLSNVNFQTRSLGWLQHLRESWYSCGNSLYSFMCLHHSPIHTDSIIVAPKRLLQDPVSFRQCFGGCDDTDLWLRICAQTPVGYCDEVLSYYRKHDSNFSNDHFTMTEQALAVHEANYMRARNLLNDSDLDQYKEKIEKFRLDVAYRYRISGDILAARRVLKPAFPTARSRRLIVEICKTYLIQALHKVR